MTSGLEPMRKTHPEALLSRLRKDRALTFRLSEADLEEVKRMARALGLTATDYLLELHRIAMDLIGPRLDVGSKPAVRRAAGAKGRGKAENP